VTRVPEVRDQAPDVPLIDRAAREARLSEFWHREPSVVVFLRYFGCPFCQAQVVQLRDARARFDAVGAGIVLIGQGSPQEAASFSARLDQPFECLVDPDRSAYRAYGLVRATPSQIVRPQMALPFLRANLHRETVQRGLHGGRFLQMPGTFVIDTGGVVRMAHRNRHIADNPTPNHLLEVLEGLEHAPLEPRTG
jgi:peroxiredoxin